MIRSFLQASLVIAVATTPIVAQSEVAITGVTIVDVERGSLVPNQTVLITGGRITTIGPAGRTSAAAARTVDGRGKYLMPGLLDMHVHLTSSGNATAVEMPLLVAHGVTGVRVMSADRPSSSPANTPGLDAHRGWQRQIEAGTLTGPRLLSLATWPVNGGGGMPPGMPEYYRASSREEGELLARYFHERGFDFVKVYNNISREGYFGLADQARKLGLPFAGHEPGSVSATEISNAGQGSLEHSRIFLFNCFAGADSMRQRLLKLSSTALRRRMIDEYDPARCAEVFRVFAKNKTYVTPTLGTRKMDAYAHDSTYRNDARMKYVPLPVQLAWRADADGMVAGDPSPEGRKSYLDFYHRSRAITRDAYKAGVPVMVGTDAGDSFVFPGSSMHSELDELVAAGLTPAEALRAATLSGAEYLKRTDDLGTVRVGRFADLVLLDADPLTDVANVRKIRAVLLNGRVYERSALDGLLAGAEKAARPTPQLRLWAGAALGDTAAIAAGLAAGAQIDSLDTDRSSSGRRALNYAALGNRAAAVRLLLARGASIDLANNTGFTPLHHAVEGGALAALDVLLEAGARTDLTTAGGMTALTMAERRGDKEAVARLQTARRPASTSAESPLTLRSDWEHQRRHLLAVIDSATPQMLGFRPTPGVRTFAEQIDHVARVAALITRSAVAGQPWPEGLDADTASYLHDHARLRAQTDKFLSYVVAAVAQVPEARWLEEATLFRMTLPRHRWNVTALQHSAWTLGQIVPYLRLNGRTPPPFTPL